MKAIAGAFWLLTVFCGDMLIVIITLIHISDNMAIMFLIYAGMMLFAVIVVTFLSIYYFE
jgi:hypothetical protein